MREFRIAGPNGASTIGQLVVVRDPVVYEAAENDKPDKAQAVTLPAALCGVIEKSEDSDFWKFLVEAGLITQFNAKKIESVANNPDSLPSFAGPAIRDHLIAVRDAKSILAHIGIYLGRIDDEANDEFRRSVSEFQFRQGLAQDGLIGPATLTKLREQWPEFFNQKK